MKQKVYIETSVISYLMSLPSRDIITAARQQVTRDWWKEFRHQFEIYISALVLEEAKGGDPSAANKRLDALDGIPILKITDEAEKLATGLVKSDLVSKRHSEDALHIALATVNGMDFLLTWNFNHINNAIIKKGIATVAKKYGLECPIICSPEELIGE